MKRKTALMAFGIITLALFLISCAPNNDMYLAKAAGFWAGLWHGLIIIITFVISLFSNSVAIYEIHNNGGWYNFGFVLGILISLGHGGIWHPVKHKSCTKSQKEKEWEEIGVKVEEKVRTGIQNWLDEEDKENKKDNEWEEIAKKVEKKIKRELRNWAEK